MLSLALAATLTLSAALLLAPDRGAENADASSPIDWSRLDVEPGDFVEEAPPMLALPGPPRCRWHWRRMRCTPEATCVFRARRLVRMRPCAMRSAVYRSPATRGFVPTFW